MRILPALSLTVLVMASVGCVESPDPPAERHNVALPGAENAPAANATNDEQPTQPFALNGRISTDGQGSTSQGLAGAKILEVAKTVSIMALGTKGELIPVAEVPVQPGGGFTTTLSPNASPTQIFVMKVKDLAGAIVGSGVVNGFPAFVKGFAVDAVVDTATSFKTEILETIAKKGVPGVQNYLNVLDAYVDGQLTNSIALVGVLSTDLTSIVSATSDAVIAAENVIVDGLQKAGIPIDITALQKAQLAAVSGFEQMVKNATGQYVKTSKNLVAALQKAAAAAAKPIDDAIFNAIVNGSAAFANTFKKGTNKANFAASKSAFALQTALSTQSILDGFEKNGGAPEVIAAIKDACSKLEAAVANAQTNADLEAAKKAFCDALMGGSADGAHGVLGILADAVANLKQWWSDWHSHWQPICDELHAAFEKWDWENCCYALSKFDDSAHAMPTMKGMMSDGDATSLSDAMRMVQKQVAQ